MEIKGIIKEIKKKRELSGLEDSFIKDRILEYLEKNKINLKSLDKRSKSYDELFKSVRKKCFDIYGLFKGGKTLETHISTKERLPYYQTIYREIFSITGKPKKILDLGCGLNPLSYKYLKCTPEYFASELSAEECRIIDSFFKINKIKGRVFQFDLLKDDYSKLPKADIVFLFKVLESLEAVKKDISLQILKKLNANWIVVSFSKKSVTGKPIRKKGRSWLKRMLAELEYEYQVLDIGDEIFYIVHKKL